MTVLLAHGADPHGELKDGVTPLMQAAWWGSTQCIALLLKHDPDFLAMDHSGHDAVMNAALRGHDGVLRMLLAAGAQADRTSAGGWTPLMFAARSGSVACTQTLIDNHADPNVTPHGWTPLKEAARNCHSKIVEVLLAAGANARFRDTDGWSAMDDAARYGCPESLKVLLATDAFDLAAVRRAAADIQDAYRHHHVSKRHAVDVERCRTMLEEHMDSNGKGA
jgi:ankyrin repeat protein